MTKNESTQPDAIAQAIVALTAAAKQTRTVGAGTWNEHQEAADFAELAAIVLASVAANVGGTEELLAGRPGSWEADLVRQLVDGTAGGDVERYRTHDDGTHVEP